MTQARADRSVKKKIPPRKFVNFRVHPQKYRMDLSQTLIVLPFSWPCPPKLHQSIQSAFVFALNSRVLHIIATFLKCYQCIAIRLVIHCTYLHAALLINSCHFCRWTFIPAFILPWRQPFCILSSLAHTHRALRGVQSSDYQQHDAYVVVSKAYGVRGIFASVGLYSQHRPSHGDEIDEEVVLNCFWAGFVSKGHFSGSFETKLYQGYLVLTTKVSK